MRGAGWCKGNKERRAGDAPLGLLNCTTEPSSLTMCTVSMPCNALGTSFLRPACSFFSSTAATLCTVLTGRRMVPLPPSCVAAPKRAFSFSLRGARVAGRR